MDYSQSEQPSINQRMSDLSLESRIRSPIVPPANEKDYLSGLATELLFMIGSFAFATESGRIEKIPKQGPSRKDTTNGSEMITTQRPEGLPASGMFLASKTLHAAAVHGLVKANSIRCHINADDCWEIVVKPHILASFSRIELKIKLNSWLVHNTNAMKTPIQLLEVLKKGRESGIMRPCEIHIEFNPQFEGADHGAMARPELGFFHKDQEFIKSVEWQKCTPDRADFTTPHLWYKIAFFKAQLQHLLTDETYISLTAYLPHITITTNADGTDPDLIVKRVGEGAVLFQDNKNEFMGEIFTDGSDGWLHKQEDLVVRAICFHEYRENQQVENIDSWWSWAAEDESRLLNMTGGMFSCCEW